MQFACRLALVILIGFLNGACGNSTVSIPTVTGEYIVTFNATKISESQLRELYQLSPELYPDLLFLLGLEACSGRDPDYLPCGTGNLTDPHFFANADINLRKARQRVDSLRALQRPPELEPIAQYVMSLQAFYVCLDENRLAYYRSGKIDALLRQCGGLDPAVQCPHIIDRLKVSSPDSRWGLTRKGLHACMNLAFHERLGEYPQHAWRKFLETFSVREEFEDEID